MSKIFAFVLSFSLISTQGFAGIEEFIEHGGEKYAELHQENLPKEKFSQETFEQTEPFFNFNPISHETKQTLIILASNIIPGGVAALLLSSAIVSAYYFKWTWSRSLLCTAIKASEEP